jgi:hypothetical protein
MEIGTFEHDNLLASETPPLVTGVGTILRGEGTLGVLTRGTVMGKVKVGTVPATGTAGANTGTGTCASVTASKGIKPGTYTLTCIDVIANSGLFRVVDPDGNHIGVARVGVAFTSPQINFTLSDATDFVAGDSFTIVVPAGSGFLRRLNSANVDGSGVPFAVLAEKRTIEAGAESLAAPLYVQGHLNEAKLVFGGSDTIATHREALKELNLITSKNRLA